ncbi:MAG: hypothetical protein FJZ58_06345 [Chlamydiae bacterium]|nr:hypothetical protein [Chlamydiota bacterium]
MYSFFAQGICLFLLSKTPVSLEKEITYWQQEQQVLEKKISLHRSRALDWQLHPDLACQVRHEYELADQLEDRLRIVNKKIEILQKKKR